MPLSAKSLERSGRISSRQMSKLPALKGTRSEPSKMAPFDSKRKGEGSLANKGHLKPSQINTQHQRTPGKFKPTRGGGVPGRGDNLKRRQIDEAEHQRPRFPAGGDVSARNPKTGNTRMKGGRTQRTGNVYDTPGRN